MEKYTNYKDSGIEWLGVIPKHWEVKRIKDTGIVQNGFAFKSNSFRNKGTRVLKITNIQPMNIDFSDESFVDDSLYSTLKPFRILKGDIVFALTRPIISTGIKVAIVKSDKKLLLNQRNAVFRSKKNIVKEYFYFVLLSNSFIDSFDNYIDKTGTQPNISATKISWINIQIPTLKEQTQIANYLDAKTTAIDKKVTLLQQKIKHYKAYRKTLINEAVTKGLDKSVKLKDSSIEWIGEIPKHWEVIRLKTLGDISTSSVNKKIEGDEKLVSLVNYTDVYDNLNKEVWNGSNYMKVSAKPNQIIQKNLKKGDVLFTPSSETVEDIGVSAVVMEDLKNTLYSYHILRLRFNQKVYDNFKKYMFNNDFAQYYFSKSTKGTTRKILGLNDFNNLPIILPPSVEEQKLIADFLDTKTTTIDKIVKNIETQITTLKELRKTLINEVVTGKVKVSQPIEKQVVA